MPRGSDTAERRAVWRGTTRSPCFEAFVRARRRVSRCRERLEQRGAEGRHRREARLRILLQRATHHRVERRGDEGAVDRRRALARVALATRVRSREGRVAREHLVEHHAERVDVGARIRRGAAGLLEGHVLRRAHHVPARLLQVAGQVGEAEIEHLHLLATVGRVHEEEVLRLDVAVHDAGLVRGAEPERGASATRTERAGPSDPVKESVSARSSPTSSSITKKRQRSPSPSHRVGALSTASTLG